jgi:tRNA pseudouridine38-40 synthase
MAFDGTAYQGWQVQPNGPTIQAVMEQALSALLKEQIEVTGAGRTDTGVHASVFIAHFDCTSPGAEGTSGQSHDPEEEQFRFRLNRFLPEDIVVYRIRRVPDEMHARFSAQYRTYQYHISSVKPLFTRRYTHYIYGPLDLDEIRKCCRIIIETTDFTSFSKLHTDVKTNHCKVSAAEWKEMDRGYVFEITADRFLRDMVRSIVGTLLAVGLGKLNSEDFQTIIKARDRSRAGQSVPAHGLFLTDIGYAL